MVAALTEIFTVSEISTVLAKGPFAAAAASGATLVVGTGEPPRAVFATPSALAALGARDLATLDAALFNADSPGARRLRQLARTLPLGAPPRLENLRFFAGRLPVPVGWMCARVAGPGGADLIVAAAPVRASGSLAMARAPAIAESELKPFTPTPLDGPVRFLWSCDDQGRFGAPDPALAARVGAHAPREGESSESLHARIGFDAEDLLGAAIAARRTFAGLRIEWPEPGATRARVVQFSGAPIMDREAGFRGYRGFGVFTGEGVSLAPEPALEIAAPPAVETTSVDVEPRGPSAEAEKPEARGTEAPAPTPEPAAKPEESLLPPRDEATVAEAPVDPIANRTSDVGEISSAALASPPPAAPYESLEAELSAVFAGANSTSRPEEPTHTDSGPRIEEAPAEALPPPSLEALASSPKSGREGGAEIYLLRPPSAAPTHAMNVVPIRPGALSVFAAPPESAEGDALKAGENVELSLHERDAFREIARALGARAKDARPERSAGESPEPGEDAEPSAPIGAGAHPSDIAALLDALPIGALVTRDGEPLYLNQTLLDLVGYASIEAFREVGGLDAIFRGRDPAAMVGEGGDLPLVAAGGDVINVDAHARAIAWKGAPAVMIALRRSRMMEHDAALRVVEREARAHAANARDLSAALDLAADGMIRLDNSGRILAMNRRAEALLGYDQKETTGENFLMLFAPDSQAEASQAFERIVREPVTPARALGPNVFARERGGRAIPARLDFGQLSTAGAPEYILLLQDLSRLESVERDHETAREAAEKASARKTEFLARVSHEIRTPLHAILGFAEVMIEERFGPVGNERYKDYIKDIHASGRHVMSLANDLLDLAKIEAGRMELQFSPVDINKVIRECVALMQPQASRERIIVRLSLLERLPNVMADERSLRQIMLNLMSNAVKYNEPGGQVIVSTALDESGHAVIRVRDTGLGMNESELNVALEPFRRLPNGARDGAGLGLPLTKALAEANHADFTIKSRKDHGTLVEVAFASARAAQ